MPIVEAVGIAGPHIKNKRAEEIVGAMVAAAQAAREEGITDPETIRKKIIEARDSVARNR